MAFTLQKTRPANETDVVHCCEDLRKRGFQRNRRGAGFSILRRRGGDEDLPPDQNHWVLDANSGQSVVSLRQLGVLYRRD